MKVHLVYKFTSSTRINVFHYCMFHGDAQRKGIVFPEDAAHYWGDDLSDPLVLLRNGTIVPDIFRPQGSLIVSEKVKNALQGLPHIHFLQVVFKKLVDYPFHAGDFSYFKRAAFQKDPRKEDPETLIKRLPDVPKLHSTIGRYFEMVVARLSRISSKKLANVPFQIVDLGDNKEVAYPVSKELLDDYPILRAADGILIVQRAFEILHPYFDWDYFADSVAEI